MRKCTDCEFFENIDPEDGMVFQCQKIGRKIFLDDIPFICLLGCPFKSEEDKDEYD